MSASDVTVAVPVSSVDANGRLSAPVARMPMPMPLRGLLSLSLAVSFTFHAIGPCLLR
ncbi:hypothetical protein [Streptomyces beigongshangae]|uniref:hypothetical protein n=1 Tax=Streptomyces beigongshangae TaxID=2841597 RepID=UPI001C861692|nr:hypothetical protein [Streptomyces sp. REN17]